jgi:hypothetical protein
MQRVTEECALYVSIRYLANEARNDQREDFSLRCGEASTSLEKALSLCGVMLLDLLRVQLTSTSFSPSPVLMIYLDYA